MTDEGRPVYSPPLWKGGCPIQIRYHVGASILVAAAYYAVTGSAPGSLLCAASGVLIDVDHFYDYLRHPGRRLDWKHFVDTHYHARLKRIVLFLHSWELLLLLWLGACFTRHALFFLPVAVGFTQHMLLDCVRNCESPLTYFILYRMAKGFSGDLFHPCVKERREGT